ncbi:hypothetical protein FJTKL_10773 [Diaporthe vaccinii]|uniref:Cytochrome P450 n=1 Tax=Diaporthe vaccinii TaxID=105482 RepID=A0ABR4FBQ2_9PEZI
MDNQTTKASGIVGAAANATQWSSLVFLSLSLLTFWYLLVHFVSPVRGYPGPFLAKYTNLWRTWHASRRNIHLVYQELHRKYGPIVRVGPNVLDVDLPEIIKPAFNDIKGDWQKTDFYHSSSAQVSGKLIFNLFSETDAKKHAREKRPVAKYYSKGAVAALEPHVDAMISKLCNDRDYHDPEEPDFLDHFIEAKKADPEDVDDAQIVSWLMINVLAGADTTALALKTAFYYCLRDERIWQRLRKELLAAGSREATPVPYGVAHSAPYLEAVVREALRILPGISMPLERYVPKDGYRLSDGSFLPGGSTVGVNPYLIARNKEIYGDDVEEFRPERWLRDEATGETQEQFEARLAAMNSVDLTFGGGRRLCIVENYQ